MANSERTEKTDEIVKFSDIFSVNKSSCEYWLYFIKGDSKVQNWFCKDYGHIVILTRDELKWDLINPWPTQLKIDLLPFDINDNLPVQLINFLKAKACVHIVVRPRCATESQYKWWHFFLPRLVSCASIVKYILGIKLKGATPLGFVKHLKKLVKNGFKDPIKKLEFLYG